MTDWQDFKSYSSSQTINNMKHQISEGQVAFRVSGQIVKTNSFETVTIDSKKYKMIPLLKVSKYLVSPKALPSKDQKVSPLLGLLKLDNNENPFYIIYNSKTKNFGLLAGEATDNKMETESEKKMLKHFISVIDKKVFWAEIRYLYK